MYFSFTTGSPFSIREACEIEKSWALKTLYLFTKVCLNKMLAHASFAPKVHPQCLDYARNDLWNAITSKAILRNEQFLNLQVPYPECGMEDRNPDGSAAVFVGIVSWFTLTITFVTCYYACNLQFWKLMYQLTKYGELNTLCSTLSSKSKLSHAVLHIFACMLLCAGEQHAHALVLSWSGDLPLKPTVALESLNLLSNKILSLSLSRPALNIHLHEAFCFTKGHDQTTCYHYKYY